MELLRSVSKSLKALHRDEQGADMIEYILIIAAIALPLLGVIIWFWKDLIKVIDRYYKEATDPDFKGTDPGDL